MNKIIFIAAHLPQPRVIRRIKSIKKEGFDIKVYGYNTGLYPDNLKDYGDIPLIILSNTNGFSRLKRTLISISNLRRIYRETDSDDIFYVFGLPLGISVRFFTRINTFIYEEADMMPSNTSKVVQLILRIIDKKIIKKSLATIFTSQGFSDFLYGNKPPKNLMVIPNKLNLDILNFPRQLKCNISMMHLNFGFVGAIRFPNTLLRFAHIIGEKYTQHKFHFYGDGESKIEVEKLIQQYNNIYYHGPFKSPQDLAYIYSKIDINVACYDTNITGVRIGEPNKLYESIYFGKPIIVSENSFIGKKVLDLGVGFAINACSDIEIEKFINNLTIKKLNLCINNSINIPTKELIDDPTILINLLKDKE